MGKIIDRIGKGSDISAAENDANLSSLSGINAPITTTTHTIDVDDQNDTLEYLNALSIAVTLPSIASVTGANLHTDDFTVTLKNVGAGTVTATRGSTDTFEDASTSIALLQYEWVTLQTDNSLTKWNIINSGGGSLLGITATATELNILDGVTSTTAELNLVDGSVTGTAVASKALVLGATKNIDTLDIALNGFKIDAIAVTATAAELNTLDGITSTVAELNILDGVTATTAEINDLAGNAVDASDFTKLSQVTSTSAELNILDGVTATAAELNIIDGVTATTTELNILDGVTSTASELNDLDKSANTITAYTPTIVGSTGGAATINSTTCRWYKVGRLTTVFFDVLFRRGTMTGNVQFGNSPDSNSTFKLSPLGIFTGFTGAVSADSNMCMNMSSTTWDFSHFTATGSRTNVVATDIPTGTDVWIEATLSFYS